ncbi:secreted protein [Rhodopirellula sallentina]|uniref:Secreted protein n=1 Tax=Rhodopirellula sallentina SM41 TaxID=1263870 RepID=M5TY71_9BACT|nr:secreted protein [Rhodopirellula sallentina]EMI54162.1 secreted protein [Rhodopirellula sallentina SM41]
MNRFLSFGVVAVSIGIGASVANAQNFVGPRYPGEVIISERVITPRPEPQKGNTLPPPAKDRKESSDVRDTGRSVLVKSPNGDQRGDRRGGRRGTEPQGSSGSTFASEPMSLSDGGLSRGGLRGVEETPERIPMLALGHEVWGKMLELERENAKLEATLEYERRLATFREHSERAEEAQAKEIKRMKEELAKQQGKIRHLQEANQGRIEELARLVEERTRQVVELQRQIRESEAMSRTALENMRRPFLEKLSEQAKLVEQFESRQHDMQATIARLQNERKKAADIARSEPARAVPSESDHSPVDPSHAEHGDMTETHVDAEHAAMPHDDHAHGDHSHDGHALDHHADASHDAHAEEKVVANKGAGKKTAKTKAADKKADAKQKAERGGTTARDDGASRDRQHAQGPNVKRPDGNRPAPRKPDRKEMEDNRRDDRPRGRRGRFRGVGANSAQPEIRIAVLPVGFSMPPITDETVASSLTDNPEDASDIEPVVGLHGGAIGPLGKNAEPAEAAESEDSAGSAERDERDHTAEPPVEANVFELPAPKVD